LIIFAPSMLFLPPITPFVFSPPCPLKKSTLPLKIHFGKVKSLKLSTWGLPLMKDLHILGTSTLCSMVNAARGVSMSFMLCLGLVQSLWLLFVGNITDYQLSLYCVSWVHCLYIFEMPTRAGPEMKPHFDKCPMQRDISLKKLCLKKNKKGEKWKETNKLQKHYVQKQSNTQQKHAHEHSPKRKNKSQKNCCW